MRTSTAQSGSGRAEEVETPHQRTRFTGEGEFNLGVEASATEVFLPKAFMTFKAKFFPDPNHDPLTADLMKSPVEKKSPHEEEFARQWKVNDAITADMVRFGNEPLDNVTDIMALTRSDIPCHNNGYAHGEDFRAIASRGVIKNGVNIARRIL